MAWRNKDKSKADNNNELAEECNGRPIPGGSAMPERTGTSDEPSRQSADPGAPIAESDVPAQPSAAESSNANRPSPPPAASLEREASAAREQTPPIEHDTRDDDDGIGVTLPPYTEQLNRWMKSILAEVESARRDVTELMRQVQELTARSEEAAHSGKILEKLAQGYERTVEGLEHQRPAFLSKLREPFLRELLMLFDRASLFEEESTGDARERLTRLRKQIEEVMYRMDVEAMDLKPETGFDPKNVEIVQLVRTERPELHAKIARVVRTGFVFETKRLRPARIHAYQFAHADQSSVSEPSPSAEANDGGPSPDPAPERAKPADRNTNPGA